VQPEALVDQLYLPARRGSLQAELLGAARRSGRIPFLLPATPQALSEELAAGHPVLVLQNLGLSGLPRWHYAVVVGFSRDSGYLLRSGRTERQWESVQDFMTRWQGGGFWGLVALPPGDLPASVEDPQALARSVALAEAYLQPFAAREAWSALRSRWPEQPDVLFGAANAQRRAGDTDAAAALYRALLRRDVGHAAARNNFADLLLYEGCYGSAEAVLAGVPTPPTGSALAEALSATRHSLEQARRAGGSAETPEHCRALSGEIAEV
jgi:hypothetical protein